MALTDVIPDDHIALASPTHKHWRDNDMLKGVVITCNYPDDEVDAAIPSEMTVDQLCEFVRRLMNSEPAMTSFVITAALVKA